MSYNMTQYDITWYDIIWYNCFPLCYYTTHFEHVTYPATGMVTSEGCYRCEVSLHRRSNKRRKGIIGQWEWLTTSKKLSSSFSFIGEKRLCGTHSREKVEGIR